MSNFTGPEQDSDTKDRKSESYALKQRLLRRAWDSKGDASHALRILNNMHHMREVLSRQSDDPVLGPRPVGAERSLAALNLAEWLAYEEWRKENSGKTIVDYLEINQRFLPADHVQGWLLINPDSTVRDYIKHHGYTTLPKWTDSGPSVQFHPTMQ